MDVGITPTLVNVNSFTFNETLTFTREIVSLRSTEHQIVHVVDKNTREKTFVFFIDQQRMQLAAY